MSSIKEEESGKISIQVNFNQQVNIHDIYIYLLLLTAITKDEHRAIKKLELKQCAVFIIKCSCKAMNEAANEKNNNTFCHTFVLESTNFTVIMINITKI